jgi:hypothetical protein
MTTSNLSRRALVAAAGSLAAAPALAASGSGATTARRDTATTIGRLWRDAEELRARLDVHRDAIAIAAEAGGIPGWMRMTGEVNRLGEARYGKLIGILNTEPESPADLGIMARVALEDEIRNGSFGWAGQQLARATMVLHGTVTG